MKTSRPSVWTVELAVDRVLLELLLRARLGEPDQRADVEQVELLVGELAAELVLAADVRQRLGEREAEVGQQPRARVLRAVDVDALVRRGDGARLARELRVLLGRLGELRLGLVAQALRLLRLADRLAGGEDLVLPRGAPVDLAGRLGDGRGDLRERVVVLLRQARSRRRGSGPAAARRRARTGCRRCSRAPRARARRRAPPSAHGKIAPGCSPYHSVVPTGTMPRASSESCSRRPTTTTRSGASVIVVSPYLCGIVTGNASASAVGAAAAGARPRRRCRRRTRRTSRRRGRAGG